MTTLTPGPELSSSGTCPPGVPTKMKTSLQALLELALACLALGGAPPGPETVANDAGYVAVYSTTRAFVALRSEVLAAQAARDSEYEMLQLVEAVCLQHRQSAHAAAVLDLVRATPEGFIED